GRWIARDLGCSGRCREVDRIVQEVGHVFAAEEVGTAPDQLRTDDAAPRRKAENGRRAVQAPVTGCALRPFRVLLLARVGGDERAEAARDSRPVVEAILVEAEGVADEGDGAVRRQVLAPYVS